MYIISHRSTNNNVDYRVNYKNTYTCFGKWPCNEDSRSTSKEAHRSNLARSFLKAKFPIFLLPQILPPLLLTLKEEQVSYAYIPAK